VATPHGERGEHLGDATAAQLASQQADADDAQGDEERGDRAEPEQRVAEQDVGGPGDERGDRWLVDVPAVEVAAGGDEVELVAVVPVAGREREHRRRRDRGDPEHRTHREGLQRARAVAGADGRGVLGGVGGRGGRHRGSAPDQRPDCSKVPVTTSWSGAKTMQPMVRSWDTAQLFGVGKNTASSRLELS